MTFFWLWLIGLLGLVLVGVLTELTTNAISTFTSAAWKRLAKPSPLSAVVERQAARSQSYLFLDGIEALTKPPGDELGAQGRQAWAHKNEGIDAYTTRVRVVVQGKSASQVVLTDLTVKIHERRPVPLGAILQPPGAGPVATRYFHVNLDEPQPYPRAHFPDEARSWQSPIDFPYAVSSRDAEVFLILADTREFDCSWSAELGWAAEGRIGQLSLTDQGRPFRTVSGDRATRYTVLGGAIVSVET